MSRRPSLREALDASLARLAKGESISQCLYHYPYYADRLRPLLEAAMILRSGPVPAPRPEAVDAGYDRMMAVVRAKQWRTRDDLPANRPGGPGWLLRVGGVIALLVLIIGAGWLWQGGDLTNWGRISAQAVVTDAEGIVLRLPAGSRTWQTVSAGDVLASGDKMRTESAARAQVSVGQAYSLELFEDAEVVFRAMPVARQAEIPAVIHQAQGQVYYRVDTTDGLTDPTPAGTSEAPETEEADAAIVLQVSAPVLVADAVRANFVVAVVESGGTAISVDGGNVTVSADDQVRVVTAGFVALMEAGGTADLAVLEKGVLPPDNGWGLGLQPGNRGSVGEPPSADADDHPDEADSSTLTPPGLEDKGGVPPGQEDTDDVPPGLEDKGGCPLGRKTRMMCHLAWKTRAVYHPGRKTRMKCHLAWKTRAMHPRGRKTRAMCRPAWKTRVVYHQGKRIRTKTSKRALSIPRIRSADIMMRVPSGTYSAGLWPALFLVFRPQGACRHGFPGRVFVRY